MPGGLTEVAVVEQADDVAGNATGDQWHAKPVGGIVCDGASHVRRSR
jgi:hypothetical protein